VLWVACSRVTAGLHRAAHRQGPADRGRARRHKSPRDEVRGPPPGSGGLSTQYGGPSALSAAPGGGCCSLKQCRGGGTCLPYRVALTLLVWSQACAVLGEVLFRSFKRALGADSEANSAASKNCHEDHQEDRRHSRHRRDRVPGGRRSDPGRAGPHFQLRRRWLVLLIRATSV